MLALLVGLLALLGLLDVLGMLELLSLLVVLKFYLTCLICQACSIYREIFRNVGEKILKEISLENVKVEHDFSGGLSKRVTLKFFWQPPNLTRIGNPYDFGIAS